MNTPSIALISSMATQAVLTELVALYRATTPGLDIQLTSIGGVDAAKRIVAGDAFDGVILGSNAIDKLIDSGHMVVGSRVDLVRSGVAVAVRAGAARPAINDEAAVKAAVLAAPTLGYSTGPSGVALAALFERWGIADAVQAKLVVPPPGTPVGALIARGDVALGFQQLSELMHLDGVQVLGPLPASIQIETVFAGGVVAASVQRERVREVLRFMADASTAAVKQRHGMAGA